MRGKLCKVGNAESAEKLQSSTLWNNETKSLRDVITSKRENVISRGGEGGRWGEKKI